ncbi:hypothetical protein RHMOL_Rhmol01G0123700 [Rhododendron molle]|uniref:Uncharacterized protein n=1 Tax=Rhododendron molle TaxID=49168 RepID=A0ACC0Q237_RHOML|nr:hypothetical protein RHMOL_Rhmol01G0123700 [Rhododendron molle]
MELNGVRRTRANFIYQPKSPTPAGEDASSDHDLQGTTSKSCRTIRRKRWRRGNRWWFGEEEDGGEGERRVNL